MPTHHITIEDLHLAQVPGRLGYAIEFATAIKRLFLLEKLNRRVYRVFGLISEEIKAVEE
jgi:hypothetical protein